MAEKFLMVAPLTATAELKDEFETVVSKLKHIGLQILVMPVSDVVKGNQYLCSRDWISFDVGKVATVYPMSLLERQRERNDMVFEILEQDGYEVSDVIDFTDAETEGVFLEGLSSVVLDRNAKVAYLSVSSVCDLDLFIEFCEELEYTPIIFNEEFSNKNEVLKTSKIITICKDFILVCSTFIENKKERKLVLTQLKKSGREIIYLDKNQIESFANDVVQCVGKDGDAFVLVSKTAFAVLKDDQKEKIKKYGAIKVIDCKMIEKFANHSLGAMMNKIVE